jgi:hypothetical protein
MSLPTGPQESTGGFQRCLCRQDRKRVLGAARDVSADRTVRLLELPDMSADRIARQYWRLSDMSADRTARQYWRLPEMSADRTARQYWRLPDVC